MDRLIDRLPELGALERTLRRIAVGARIFAAAWMLVLAITTLVDPPGGLDRPGVVAAVGLVGVVWAATSVVVFSQRPDGVTSRPFVMVDGLVAVGALLAPAWAGAPDLTFYGGLPLIVVGVAAIRGPRSAWLSAAAMVVAVLVRQGTPVPSVSQVITYGAGAFIFTWIVGVLRAWDAEREATRAAMIEAEAARARAAERVEISRHLHDSVLQTLALIQRASDRPSEVVTLARRQERELRSWLVGEGSQDTALGPALRRMAERVERDHHVPVDVVVVGESSAVPAPLVAAVREAAVNAALHSGAPQIDVYGEAADGLVRVFVRDRGSGFDSDRVPPDRQGIRQSIVGRLEDAGGAATLRTGVGSGTEWRLEMPL